MNRAKIILRVLSWQNPPRRQKTGSYKFCHATRKIIFALLTLVAGAAYATCDNSMLTLKVGGVMIKADVAKTEAERARGLMGRRSLPKNWGMWFTFGGPSITSFWMKDTFVPLDLIFVGRDMIIVHIFENARPMDETPIGAPGVFWYVLEVPAGFAKAHHVQVGDRILNLTPKC